MIDYSNYTAEDWYTRLDKRVAQGEYGTVSASCPDCYLVIPVNGIEAYPGRCCKCGQSITMNELLAVHGLTDLPLRQRPPSPIETWAEVS